MKIKKNNQKGIIVIFCLVLLLITTMFVFGSNITRLLSSVYNVEDIQSNIDQLQIGDKINYSANGVDDWEVLSIDKSTNTIEIVSTDEVGRLELTGYKGWKTAKEKMLEIANKYVTGDYAISARNLNANDIISSNISKNGCMWLDDQRVSRQKGSGLPYAYDQAYYCQGNTNYFYTTLVYGASDYYGYLVVVTLKDDNASSYKQGDKYEYTSNGITDWKVFKVNDNSTISIIPSEKQQIDLATDERLTNENKYMDQLLEGYKDNDKVTDVRYVNISDKTDLVNLGYTNSASFITSLDGFSDSYSYENSYGDTLYKNKYDNYKCNYIYYDTWNHQYYESYSTSSIYTLNYGVRPVIKLKYSDNLVKGNDLNTDIRVGDNVKYEAKSYNDWKVLSIDQENGTAEIVSSSIVELLTLSGLDDYNNAEQKFQEIVDEYATGEGAISGRMLKSSDIETLTMMKDNYAQKYWLGDKQTYKYRTEVLTVTDEDIYGIAVASYDASSLNITRQWATLEAKMEDTKSILSYKSPGTYDYTAGIRPVITVKLEKITKDDGNNNNDSNNDIIVPDNKEETLPDKNIISSNNIQENNNQNNNIEQNNNTDNLDNKQENIENDKTNTECKPCETNKTTTIDNDCKKSSNNVVKTKDLFWIIALSFLAGAITSGLIVYYITKNKYKKVKKHKKNH